LIRKPLIAGNWKMNLTHLEAIALTQKLAFSLDESLFANIEVSVLPQPEEVGPADADAVAARTLPGVSELGAYFTRGSGHGSDGAYTETPEQYQAVVDRLTRKHAAVAEHIPAPLVGDRAHAPLGIVTLGSCELAVLEAIEILAERGVTADYMRIRGFPFGAAVRAFLDAHERLVVVEENRDAQLRTLLTMETPVPKEKLESVLVYGGYPLSAEDVVDGVIQIVGS